MRSWPVAVLAIFLSMGLPAVAASCSSSGKSELGGGAGGAKQSSGTESTGSNGPDGSLFGDSPMGSCTAKTCMELNATCGPMGDGCGSVVQCGDCKAPETCGGGGVPSQCGGDSGCVPTTCAALKIDCGPAGDGCGKVLQCGDCKAPESCGGGGKPSECGGNTGCMPTTCLAAGANCGPIGDGCGGVLPSCGTCVAPEECGGLKPSQCGVPPAPGPDAGNPCVPTTCAAVGPKTCGPVADGCGNVIPCGNCMAPETCGGGGKPSQCGGNNACVPTTCLVLGVTCGPASDGCGNQLDCGTCSPPETCGGGGKPSQCGGNNGCVPATCPGLGLNCGPIGDGCGNLLQCGGVQPQICGGGGKPSVCGPLGGGGQCIPGDMCNVVCAGGGTTTVSGTVVAPTVPNPALGIFPDPIYDALVYVPSAPVEPFTPGVSCDQCGAAASGDPIVTAVTGPDGTFQLQNVPVGTNIPLVIQLGRWRMQVKIPNVVACQDNPLPTTLTRLPRNRFEGDIPLMAMVTGVVDPLECVLRKIGIQDSEFTVPAINGGSGRVQFFIGTGTDEFGDPDYGSDVKNGGAPLEESLMSTPTIDQYDMVIFACVGDEEDKLPIDQTTVIDYANAGGRIFATHYSYVWLFDDAPFSGTAVWDPNSPNAALQTDPLPAFIDQSFPKGIAFATWLNDVGASPAGFGQISIAQPRYDFDSVIAPAQQWIYWQQPPNIPIHYTFNTPVGAAAAQQCGRVLYSDFHVSAAAEGADEGLNFPEECDTGPLTAQERVIEFMLFDLASCVTPDNPPPPMCTPQGCGNILCGPSGDGCGNEIMCGTCPAGEMCGVDGNPGVCGSVPCTPKSCVAQGIFCGPAGDGCGNMIDCGACQNGQACGGGGKPNQCGGMACIPQTCADQHISCGLAGDGCGKQIICGMCVPGEMCGAGGVPGVCGEPEAGACVPLTCADQKIDCGPAGDGCGKELMCGTCAPPETCGGGGKPGQCGGDVCLPETCKAQKISCGPAGDGCGNELMCGTCTPPDTCGGGGVPGVCGAPMCTPLTCAKLGLTCGPAGDGCGNLLQCGTCKVPETCGGGGTPGVCGTMQQQ